MNAHRIVTTKNVSVGHEVNARREINDGKLFLKPENEQELKELEMLCAKGKTAVCQAAWFDLTRLKFSGLGSGSALVLRSQADADVGRLSRLCPADQSCAYRASWRGDEGLELVRIEEAEPGEKPSAKSQIAQIAALSETAAKELASELSLPWDDKASRATMNKRIADAAAARGG